MAKKIISPVRYQRSNDLDKGPELIKTVKGTATALREYNSELNNFCRAGKFYIYDAIDEDFPKAIIEPLVREIHDQLERSTRYPIEFFISSPGGIVNYGLDLISLFEIAEKNHIEIHTHVYSDACSCASLIAAAGTVRYVSSRASHLLHFARGWDYAHNPEMGKRNQEFFEFQQQELMNIYKTKTKGKIKDLEKKLLADNFRVNGGKDLIKFGLADQLI